MTPERRAELREMLVSLIQPGPDPSSGVDALHWCIEGRRKIACEALAVMDHLDARERRLREALEDMLSGWRYIREQHGDLDGVGWDRAEDSARAALSEVAPDA
jgi:hypothetical protein